MEPNAKEKIIELGYLMPGDLVDLSIKNEGRFCQAFIVLKEKARPTIRAMVKITEETWEKDE